MALLDLLHLSIALKLLDLVLPLPSDEIPTLSILREFIGKGYFE